MDGLTYDMPLFAGADPAIVKEVMDRSNSRMRYYRKGETIARQNEVCRTLMLLCEGSVYARMTSREGREFTLDLLTAPDIVASPFIFATENIYPVTILAQSDCRLWIIDRSHILKLLERDTAILRNFLRDLSDHSLYLSRKLHEFVLQNLSSRVLGYLKDNHEIRNLQQTASSWVWRVRRSRGPSPSCSPRAASAKPTRNTRSPDPRAGIPVLRTAGSEASCTGLGPATIPSRCQALKQQNNPARTIPGGIVCLPGGPPCGADVPRGRQ